MNLDLADSALHAAAGSWDGEDFYPDFIDEAAALLVRLAKTIRSSTATSVWRG